MLIGDGRGARLPGGVAPYYVERAIEGAHAHNVVNAILVDFRALDTLGDTCEVHVAGRRLPLSTTYGERESGALMALVGSTQRLEIAVNGGSAAAVLGLGRGEAVSVRRR